MSDPAPPPPAPPGWEIRRALHQDLPGLTALERRSFPEPWLSRSLAAEIDLEQALVLVALPAAPGRGRQAATPEVVGYAGFRCGPGEAELLRLAVAPEHQRRGIARALLACGQALLAADGITSIHLEVRSTNRAAIELYRSLGWHPAGRRRAYYRDGSDALLFSYHPS